MKILPFFFIVLTLIGQILHGAPVAGNDLYPGQTVWEIKPAAVWNQTTIKSNPAERKARLYNLYEEIKPGGNPVPGQSEAAKDMEGLNISQYYLGWDYEQNYWVIVDIMGNVYTAVKMFYSPNPVYSRQKAVDEMLVSQKQGPPVNRNREYRWTMFGDGIKMAFLQVPFILDEDKKLCGEFFAEQEGFSLIAADHWFFPLIRKELKDKELFEISETILAALNGKRQFGYFPKRTRQAVKKWKDISKMPYQKRTRREEELRKLTKGMPEGLYDRIDRNARELQRNDNILNLNMPDGNEDKGPEMIPNINSGIGTVRWLKKHVNIPFIAEKGHDESHINGCSGTFSVNKNGRDYPVTYTILHLHTKDQALRAMFAMQAEQSRQLIKPDILKKILQVHPGLVGDYDVCLKPVINELGVPVSQGEYSSFSFIRGNTAVMLKNESMDISVLPLAKQMDEALLKNMQLFMKPEETR